MLHPIFGALHRHGAHPSGLASLHQFVFPQGQCPPFNTLVQLLLAFKTPQQRNKVWNDGPLGRTHQLYQALPLCIGGAGDDTPVIMAASLGAVSVVGSHRGATVIVYQRRSRPVSAVARGISLPDRGPAIDCQVQQRRAVQGDTCDHL